VLDHEQQVRPDRGYLARNGPLANDAFSNRMHHSTFALCGTIRIHALLFAHSCGKCMRARTTDVSPGVSQ
jgi:hypothetical protein